MSPIRKFIDSILSDSGSEGLTRLERSLRFSYLLAVHGGKQLVRHRAPQLAAALAYRTIFSLVPVLVLILVVLNATFDKEAIERAFNSVFEYTGLADIQVPAVVPEAEPEASSPGNLVEVGPPQTDPQDPSQGEEPSPPADTESDEAPTVALTEYLSEFVERAANTVTNLRFGVITVFGLALFLYAAISLLIQVEAAFNVITGARRGRRIPVRLINYWAVLTLGTILIVASLAIGQIYTSQLANLPGWLGTPLSGLGRFGATWLLLVIAYMLMPTARVYLKPAAIGAAVAAIAWEGTKSGLFWFVREMTGGQIAIYGSLAILPVALLWIYITWFIVLFGLELAFSYQTVREVDLEQSLKGRIFEDDPMVDPFSPVLLITEVARGFRQGTPAKLDDIRDELGETSEVVRRIAHRLEEAGFIHTLERDVDQDDSIRLTLARSPETICVSEVLSACDGLFEPDAARARGKRGKRLATTLRGVRDAAFQSHNISELIPTPQNPTSTNTPTNESP